MNSGNIEVTSSHTVALSDRRIIILKDGGLKAEVVYDADYRNVHPLAVTLVSGEFSIKLQWSEEYGRWLCGGRMIKTNLYNAERLIHANC